MAGHPSFLVLLLSMHIFVICGQMTTTASLQLAGCTYKLVPDKDTCPRGGDDGQTTEINSLLQLISTQSTMLMQQQMALLQHQQQVDKLSKTVDALSTNGWQNATEHLSKLEDKIDRLDGLIVDLEGYNGCSNLLVSGVSPIPDSSITTSTFWNAGHGPQAIRIYTTSAEGCWAAKVSDPNQWIKFDFGRNKKVTAIVTKGRHSNHSQFVRTFKFYYSTDGTNWTVYQNDQGRDKMFPGNFDSETLRKNLLKPPVVARYVRINPVSWYGHISMRADFLGCDN